MKLAKHEIRMRINYVRFYLQSQGLTELKRHVIFRHYENHYA